MKTVALLAALTLAGLSAASVAAATPAVQTQGVLRERHDILGGAPTARLRVQLYDAPVADTSQVNVALVGIQLLSQNGAVPFATSPVPTIVNLLDLQDSALSVSGNAPSGYYAGVRLLIAPAGSSVNDGGTILPVVWGSPGAPSAGPVVAVDARSPFLLTPDGIIRNVGATSPCFTIDFNVLQSLLIARGIAYINPSVTAATAAGTVSGFLHNTAGAPVKHAVVLAVDATGKTVNSTLSRPTGKFVLHALSPGFYTIVVKNAYRLSDGEYVTASGADGAASPSIPIVVAPNGNVMLGTIVD